MNCNFFFNFPGNDELPLVQPNSTASRSRTQAPSSVTSDVHSYRQRLPYAPRHSRRPTEAWTRGQEYKRLRSRPGCGQKRGWNTDRQIRPQEEWLGCWVLTSMRPLSRDCTKADGSHVYCMAFQTFHSSANQFLVILRFL